MQSEQVETSEKNLLEVKLIELLTQWSKVEGDRCKATQPFPMATDFIVFRVRLNTGGFYEVSSSHPWYPSSIELAIIDRAVGEASEERGWVSSVEASAYPRGGKMTFRGKTLARDEKSIKLAFAWSKERAIAHLESYVKAVRGDFA